MVREITLKVVGDTVYASRDRAGVQGEGNVTAVLVSFDESWDGFTKTMTWWNALGEDPVERTLTADLLVDAARDTRTYKTTVPKEPLVEPGVCTLVIDGYTDGVRGRTASVKLEVAEAPVTEDAGEPADPTPTQAEQLQVQIESIMGDIQKAALGAEAAERAEASAAEALASAELAVTSADAAAASEATAAIKAEAAEQAAAAAALSETDAEAAAKAAQTAQTGAEGARTAAEAAAQAAQASETAAKGSETAAEESAQQAAQSAGSIQEAAQTATEQAAQAVASATDAAASAKAAAESAAEAKEIVGGDFATKGEAQNYASAAEKSAKDYTDQKIAAIPTPDVSGQIEAHNTDEAAHADIRAAVSGKAEASHTHDAGDIASGILSPTRGGTGTTSAIPNAKTGAIFRKPSDGDYLWYTDTANGAFYATGANTIAKFGTLPIAQGGTGKTTAPLGLYALINGSTALASTGLATGDFIPIGDVSATTGKKVTLANLATYLGNSMGGAFKSKELLLQKTINLEKTGYSGSEADVTTFSGIDFDGFDALIFGFEGTVVGVPSDTSDYCYMRLEFDDSNSDRQYMLRCYFGTKSGGGATLPLSFRTVLFKTMHDRDKDAASDKHHQFTNGDLLFDGPADKLVMYYAEGTITLTGTLSLWGATML